MIIPVTMWFNKKNQYCFITDGHKVEQRKNLRSVKSMLIKFNENQFAPYLLMPKDNK